MRVLYSFPTRIGTSGIGTTAWHQVKELAALGVDVTLVAGSVHRHLPSTVDVTETMRIARVKVPYRFVGPNRALHYHDWRVARLLERRAADFDIVHAWPSGAERTLLAARGHGVPGVLERPNTHTRHAFSVVAAECARLGIPVDPASAHLADEVRLAREEREFRSARALLCPSDVVLESHAVLGAAPRRLVRTQYGFDPQRFRPAASRSAGALTAAYVGRVEPRKGLHLALRAWIDAGGRRSGARLLVCGAMDASYRRAVEPLMAEAAATYLPHQGNPSAVMREADVLILPSLEEGSALVTYEARGSGCVLLVSDQTGAIVQHDQDGLVHRAGDVAQLTTHLRRLIADRAELERLRRNSLGGLDALTWQAAGTSLLKAYESVLASARTREA